MARVRSRDTQPEVILRRALWRRGCRYRMHGSLPGTPDIVFPGARVALFVDGCFWHRCPEHYTEPATNVDFWRGKIERNVSRDSIVNERLAAAGWMVLRVWEHEVISGIGAVVERVERAVRGRRNT